MIVIKGKMSVRWEQTQFANREAYIKFNRTNVDIVKKGLTQNITQASDDLETLFYQNTASQSLTSYGR